MLPSGRGGRGVRCRISLRGGDRLDIAWVGTGLGGLLPPTSTPWSCRRGRLVCGSGIISPSRLRRLADALCCYDGGVAGKNPGHPPLSRFTLIWVWSAIGRAPPSVEKDCSHQPRSVVLSAARVSLTSSRVGSGALVGDRDTRVMMPR